MLPGKKLTIAMVTVDANDATGLSHRDASRPSPVLHPAVHNLLEGLKHCDDVQIEVVYGKMKIQLGEDRREGNIHYVPVPYKPLPIRGSGGAYLARTFALLRHLARSKPDLVHGQGTERESGLVAALSRQPAVLTLHGNFRELVKTISAPRFSFFWTCARIEEWILPRLVGVHCLSEHTRSSVEPLARRTWVIPNAVSPSYFATDRKVVGHPSIVCIAGITEWKNQMLLIRASDRLVERYPTTKVHFFGACYREHPCGQSFLDAVKLRPWCVFHGMCDEATLRTALAEATCSVLPSTQENFGLALAEAMAAGVPVLGANTGGIPDVIRDHETGLLFDPDDAEALGRLLISLHADPPLMHRLAAAGRLDAIARFSIQAVAEAHVGMYRQVAALKS